MSCEPAPRRGSDEPARGRGRRWLALVAAGVLAGGTLVGCAAGDIETDRASLWTMAGGPVPGQAGTMLGQTDRGFTSKRDRLVKKLARLLRQADEQIELLDDTLAARAEAMAGQDPDDLDEMVVASAQVMAEARAALAVQRTRAGELLDQARAATSAEAWPALARETRLAVEAVEPAYDECVRHLYQ